MNCNPRVEDLGSDACFHGRISTHLVIVENIADLHGGN